MEGKLEARRRELALAELAADQYGVVSRRQLRAAGFGEGAVDLRLERGRLHTVHRGVYAVGHRVLTARGRWMAGVLAAGPGAVLSHRSAAALWDLSRYGAAIDVTVPGRAGQRAGLRMHCGRFEADEATVLDRIPTTTVARTLARPGRGATT